MVAPRRLLQPLWACFHSLCGWCCFRAGLRRLARHHFERVLRLGGGGFSAHVHLGRIAFALGDYPVWRREFELARTIDPARFARLRLPFEWFEPRLAGTDVAGGESPGAERHGSRCPQLPGPARHHARAQRADERDAEARSTANEGNRPRADGDAGPEFGPVTNDDCSTAGERARLRRLGPIRPRELGACDVDELARRLGG
ncbi:MAG: hypothetical protein FJ265_11430 [Planctomycetes bacterium]|nr:hypothetical protein [Planctomycetota bacterium]